MCSRLSMQKTFHLHMHWNYHFFLSQCKVCDWTTTISWTFSIVVSCEKISSPASELRSLLSPMDYTLFCFFHHLEKDFYSYNCCIADEKNIFLFKICFISKEMKNEILQKDEFSLHSWCNKLLSFTQND